MLIYITYTDTKNHQMKIKTESKIAKLLKSVKSVSEGNNNR